MSARQILVDTNILVYAYDIDAGDKHQIARDRISSLWHRDLLPGVSVQVLQEFYINLIRRKVPAPAARATL